MKIKRSAKRNQIAITAVIALVVAAVITIVLNTRSTQATIDCSGDWWLSSDQAAIQTCFTAPSDDASTLATQAAQPYTDTEPMNVTPVAVLPEPTESTLIEAIPWGTDDQGPFPVSWSGATTVWQDGSTPTKGYLAWAELYVLSKPGNGATYFDLVANAAVTITTNPTIETQSVMGSQYEKIWTDPQPDGALYITSITNPAYADTNSNDTYPGPTSIVYFTTKSGQTGHLDMSTGTWTFDSMSGPVPTPTAILTYP